MPECTIGLKIILYLKNITKDHKKEYQSRGANFTLAFMKLFAAIYSELILILLISEINDLADIIKDFVALGFISEIDNYFAQNISNKKLLEVYEEYKENKMEIEYKDDELWCRNSD